MMDTIFIITKQHYGCDHFYIVNTRIAIAVKKLTGRKTVTTSDIEALKELGYHIEFKSN